MQTLPVDKNRDFIVEKLSFTDTLFIILFLPVSFVELMAACNFFRLMSTFYYVIFEVKTPLR